MIGTDLVAQLVEHITFNDGVLGSSPSGITETKVKIFKSLQQYTVGGFFVSPRAVDFSFLLDKKGEQKGNSGL